MTLTFLRPTSALLVLALVAAPCLAADTTPPPPQKPASTPDPRNETQPRPPPNPASHPCISIKVGGTGKPNCDAINKGKVAAPR